MMRQVLIIAAGVALLPLAALAQTGAVAPKAATPAPAAKTAAATMPGQPSAVTKPGCFRLPLSDVAFGTEGATKYAREKLDEYALVIAKKRGFAAGKPLVKSNETVSCEVYLNLGPLGTEYRCLVTTTFCQK